MGNLVAKIVLTGGPCAGKTTTISRIEEHLVNKGYHVLVLNECATETIRGGIRPFGDHKVSVYDFENEILNLQLFKEKRYHDFLKNYSDDTNIIILCDRGSVDVKAYLGEENYQRVLEENHLTHQELLDDYDLVIHLVTVAADRYSKNNNETRFEDPEEAVDVDRRISEAWSMHPNLKVAPVCEILEDKIQIVLKYVDDLLDNIGKDE